MIINNLKKIEIIFKNNNDYIYTSIFRDDNNNKLRK